MLAVLLILGGFVPLINAQDFPLSMLSADNGLITGQFIDSLLLSMPPCSFAGKSVDVEYLNANTSEIKTLTDIFTVPDCDSIPTGTTAVSRKIGFKLMNLNNATEYKINYKIGVNKSTTVMATTRTVSDYNGINVGLPGRSAAMVVITVILSVAMLTLLVGIIVSSLMSPNEE